VKTKEKYSVVKKLLTGKNEILFNLFYLISDDKNALFITDNESYIIGKSRKAPLAWLFVNDNLTENVETEIVEVISKILIETPELIINGESTRVTGILDKVSEKMNVSYAVKMPMNVYACNECVSFEPKGKMIAPSRKYVENIARLIRQMVFDSENIDIGEKSAYEWAKARKHADNIFLWKDENIVALAMIAHKTDKYARINTVVTDREYRGKGYAKMLIATLTNQLLNQGVVPILYADANNQASNAVYQKVGYTYQGKITEFRFNNKV